MKDQSLSQTLEEVMKPVTCKYKLKEIEVVGCQYKVFGVLHDCFKSATDAVDRFWEDFNASIERANKIFQTKELGDTRNDITDDKYFEPID